MNKIEDLKQFGEYEEIVSEVEEIWTKKSEEIYNNYDNINVVTANHVATLTTTTLGFKSIILTDEAFCMSKADINKGILELIKEAGLQIVEMNKQLSKDLYELESELVIKVQELIKEKLEVLENFKEIDYKNLN